MKIAYVEDDALQRSEISRLLATCFKNENMSIEAIDSFPNAEQFFSSWYPKKYDLIILDIYIGESFGVDIAKGIRKTDLTTPIVFCSVSNDFAYESYEIGAMYYLKKPIDYYKMQQMVRRIKKLTNAEPHFLDLPSDKNVPIEEIMYTKYYNHVVHFYLERGDSVAVRTTQREIVDLLKDYTCFVSINPGTIINMNYVVAYSDGVFRLSTDEEFYVSRRRTKAVTEQYEKFVFDELRRDILW